MQSRECKFALGQVVHHRLYGYRGVVVDIDPVFAMGDTWYKRVAKSRPPKDRPWYRVLVNDRDVQSYVAEGHLEADSTGAPITHRLLPNFFDTFEGGHYTRVPQNLN